MNKTVVAIIIILAAGFLVVSVTKGDNKKSSNVKNINQEVKGDQVKNADSKYTFPGVLPKDQIENKKVVIKTSKGTIEFELYADKAPKTVSNFVYLANQKYYDGLLFHRVVPNFVIQGGDPTGTGSGGPGYQFEDEPVVGEYKAGTVAMANSGANTNGSQFFICLEDLPTLPKSYSLFGQVTVGMDVVQKIAQGDKMESIKIESK